MNKQKLMQAIEAVEGREERMYMLDGIPHIGVGHNIISRSLADKTLEVLDIEDESDLMTATLTDEQIDYLLERDLDIAIGDARDVVGAEIFDELDSERQDVVIDMSFNLGKPRFSKFSKMLAALQAGDYDEAANQILDSKAARDPLTKERYENLADRMRGTGSPRPGQVGSDLAGLTDQELITQIKALGAEMERRLLGLRM